MNDFRLKNEDFHTSYATVHTVHYFIKQFLQVRFNAGDTEKWRYVYFLTNLQQLK